MSADGEFLRPVSVTARPTDAGRALIAVTVVSLVSAWFGAGMVFSAVSALGAGVTGVAWLASRRRASGLRVRAPAPTTAWARESFLLDLEIANAARRASAFDVLVVLRGPRGERTTIGALVPEVTAGATVLAAAVYPPLRRGRHPQGAVELETTFPLGLVACRLRFELPHDVLVLPRLGSVRRVEPRGAHERSHVVHGRAGRGDEQEYHGLRDWREGESLRRVHWKLSARRGRLLVREFRGEPLPAVHVIVSSWVGPTVRDAHGRFENAVSLAATLVEHHLRRGHPVRLTVAGAQTQAVTCRRGLGGLVPALRLLAEVAPARTSPPASPPLLRGGERTFVVRVGGTFGDDLRPARAGSLRILDVADRRTSTVFHPGRRSGASLFAGARR